MYGSYKLLKLHFIDHKSVFCSMQKFFILHRKMLKQLQMPKTQSFLSWTIYREVIGFFCCCCLKAFLPHCLPAGLEKLPFIAKLCPWPSLIGRDLKNKASLFYILLELKGLNRMRSASNGNEGSVQSGKDICYCKRTAEQAAKLL